MAILTQLLGSNWVDLHRVEVREKVRSTFQFSKWSIFWKWSIFDPGSSCSTPVGSSLRTEMDYPSPNFIRPNLSQCPGVSVDENSKLTIRLHYNPVMDEWLSLTEEVVNPRARDDSDVIFDLLKDEATDNNDELIKVAQFFQVWQRHKVLFSLIHFFQMIHFRLWIALDCAKLIQDWLPWWKYSSKWKRIRVLQVCTA